jgi:hypothetical protein
MNGMQISLAVGALVALAGVLLVLTRLPSRSSQPSPNPNAGKPAATAIKPIIGSAPRLALNSSRPHLPSRAIGNLKEQP